MCMSHYVCFHNLVQESTILTVLMVSSPEYQSLIHFYHSIYYIMNGVMSGVMIDSMTIITTHVVIDSMIDFVIIIMIHVVTTLLIS